MKNSSKVEFAVLMVATAMVVLTVVPITSTFATDKNECGKLSSELGSERKMGKHASDPDHDGDKGKDDPKWQNIGPGIGNIDGHPSEVAEFLRDSCDGNFDEDRCPESSRP